MRRSRKAGLVLLLLGLAAVPGGAAAQQPLDAHYAAELGLEGPGGMLVAAAELAEMRGGFALPQGVTVAFGFDITTIVNGLPAQRFTLGPDGTLAISGAAGAPPATGAGQPLPALAETVLNDGATRILTALGLGTAATIIGNTADGQHVARHAVFDITIDGMGAQLARRAQEDVLTRALGTRALLGR